MIVQAEHIEDFVVFSGGGAGGIGQWEAYKLWCDQGFTAAKVGGTSAGCINALFAARGLHAQADSLYSRTYDGTGSTVFSPELAKIENGKLSLDMESLKRTVLKGINVWDLPKLATKKGQAKLVAALWSNVLGASALLNNTPLLVAVTEVLNMPFEKEIPMLFNVVNLLTGGVLSHALSDFSAIGQAANAIVASTNMPVILKPVPGYQTKASAYKQLVDGGLREGSPVSLMLAQMDPEKRQRLFVFNINKQQLATAEDMSNPFLVAGRVLQILLNQVLISNLQILLERNKIARLYGEKIGYKEIPLYIIEASHDRGVFDFTAESAAEQKTAALRDINNFMYDFTKAKGVAS